MPTAMTPHSRNKPKQIGEPLHLSDARLSFMFGKTILRKVIWASKMHLPHRISIDEEDIYDYGRNAT